MSPTPTGNHFAHRAAARRYALGRPSEIFPFPCTIDLFRATPS